MVVVMGMIARVTWLSGRCEAVPGSDWSGGLGGGGDADALRIGDAVPVPGGLALAVASFDDTANVLVAGSTAIRSDVAMSTGDVTATSESSMSTTSGRPPLPWVFTVPLTAVAAASSD